MKEPGLIFAALVMVLVACTGIYLGGVENGKYFERDRLYTKCLAEHETMPHKEAVALCKERVK